MSKLVHIYNFHESQTSQCLHTSKTMHFVSENSYNQIDIVAKMSCGETRLSDFAIILVSLITTTVGHSSVQTEIDIKKNLRGIKLSLKRTRSESDTIRSVIYRILFTLSIHADCVAGHDSPPPLDSFSHTSQHCCKVLMSSLLQR